MPNIFFSTLQIWFSQLVPFMHTYFYLPLSLYYHYRLPAKFLPFIYANIIMLHLISYRHAQRGPLAGYSAAAKYKS